MLIMVRLPLFCAEGPLLNLLCIAWGRAIDVSITEINGSWKSKDTSWNGKLTKPGTFGTHTLYFHSSAHKHVADNWIREKNKRLEKGRGHFDRFSEAVTHTLANIYKNKATDTENLMKVWAEQGSPLLHARSCHPCIGEPWNDSGRAADQRSSNAPTPQSRANNVLYLLLQIKWQGF